MSKLHEECGVFGIFSEKRAELAPMVYYGLFALQHRGQESCGIVVNDDGVLSTYKDVGLVNDVYSAEILDKIGMGNIALGHVRYGTTGTDGRLNCQPIVVNHVKGCMALAHNGNLTNSYKLREALELQGSIFHTTSDTEVISYLITKERLTTDSIEEAINRTMNKLEGAYSLVIMSPQKLIAVRDIHGFRPLCYGITDDGEYVIASESCALDTVGAKLIRDVEPGEIIIFEKGGPRSIKDHCNKVPRKLCVFEHIYFARPDSIIDGISVQSARLTAGVCLAEDSPCDADVVIGVPDSGLDAAIGYSRQSGIPYSIGFLKNKYIGRTFIAPGQKFRENLVRIKLNAISETVKGKRVVLVDDSIVRGTTCGRIVKILRDAGATEVHMRVSSPPFLNPCYYGTDVDSRENLIACKYSIDEIAKIIGVDSLGFLKVERLPLLIGNKKLGDGYCDGCFTNNYPTAVPETMSKSKFDTKISDKHNK